MLDVSYHWLEQNDSKQSKGSNHEDLERIRQSTCSAPAECDAGQLRNRTGSLSNSNPESQPLGATWYVNSHPAVVAETPRMVWRVKWSCTRAVAQNLNKEARSFTKSIYEVAIRALWVLCINRSNKQVQQSWVEVLMVLCRRSTLSLLCDLWASKSSTSTPIDWDSF